MIHRRRMRVGRCPLHRPQAKSATGRGQHEVEAVIAPADWRVHRPNDRRRNNHFVNQRGAAADHAGCFGGEENLQLVESAEVGRGPGEVVHGHSLGGCGFISASLSPNRGAEPCGVGEPAPRNRQTLASLPTRPAHRDCHATDVKKPLKRRSSALDVPGRQTRLPFFSGIGRNVVPAFCVRQEVLSVVPPCPGTKSGCRDSENPHECRPVPGVSANHDLHRQRVSSAIWHDGLL